MGTADEKVDTENDTFSEVQTLLKDNSIGLVGVCGLGGLGKTTLLKKIRNSCLRSTSEDKFDLVIWVPIQYEIGIPKMQKLVGVHLGLSLSEGESSVSSSQVEEQRQLLFRALSKKRFLLLLDDVWERLDLDMVGIPSPKSQSKCKIVLTTRLLDVCYMMRADIIIRMRPLDKIKSWELFCSKVGADIIHESPSIRPLAEQVVKKCSGVPLGLITVGAAMASKTLTDEWEQAVTTLNRSCETHEILFYLLKFCFDNLDDEMRSGLLYCAMYHDKAEISRAELIDHWIGEGLLDGDVNDRIGDARNRGHVLIDKLQAVCLFEAGIESPERSVRVHDIIKEMLIGLEHRDGAVLLVRAPLDKVEKLEHVERISMRSIVLTESPSCVPNCPRTRTLLLNRSVLGAAVLQRFFTLMGSLRVLDLSMAELEEIPSQIGLIVDLRYLNLSWTKIEALPKELGKLNRLRQLELEWTSKLRWIPREAIAGLSKLEVLNMWRSGYKWGRNGKTTAMDVGNWMHSFLDADAAGGDSGQLRLSDLKGLSRLQELHIGLNSSHATGKITQLRPSMRCVCTRHLHLD